MRCGRLLIVSPSFHGYWRAIERAFSELGWEASTYCYDRLDGLRAKASHKVRSELPSRLGREADHSLHERLSIAARAAVHTRQPDRVLVIKGDLLTEPFWDALERPRIPRHLWLYDELRRTGHTESSIERFDTVASYSRADVQALQTGGHNAHHVPLAFDAAVAVTPSQINRVTLVGARYPRREDALGALHLAGVPVQAFGRDWSKHWYDRVRTWRLGAPSFPTGRDLSLPDAYAVMAGSPATLNIHSDQDGFTMRTFEAAGVGGVQLVDREDVTEFYEPGREVLVYRSTDELVDLAQRSITDDRWGDRLRVAARARTLDQHTFGHRARALEATWA